MNFKVNIQSRNGTNHIKYFTPNFFLKIVQKQDPQSLSRAKKLCHPVEDNVPDATMATLSLRADSMDAMNLYSHSQ